MNTYSTSPELAEKVAKLLARRDRGIEPVLGIEFLSFECDKVVAKLPVDERTRQPFGLLHGGASVVLAESIASIGAWLNVDESKFAVVGIEINANHMRAMRSGFVTGTGKPLHKGRTTHVWEIGIANDHDQLVCISRCTLAVVPLEVTQEAHGTSQRSTS